MGRGPVFLERESYRRRRIADAARLLPVIGGILIFLPLLWPTAGNMPETAQQSADAVSTTTAFLYLFGVWALVIIAAAGLAPHLARMGGQP